MSWVDWTSLIFGTVQALATVVALYFAWRAVEEARAARQEAVKETRLARLERMAATVREIKQNYDYGQVFDRRREVERLKVLLQSTPRNELPKTRAYADLTPSPCRQEIRSTAGLGTRP